MEKRRLGTSDLQASVIGFGAWAAGRAGWGNVSGQEVEAAIRRAFELGVNFFDTAPVYGFGESEKVVGRVLKDVREQVIIATKFGLVWDAQGKIQNDLSRANILREVDESLKRLDTDYIDLYQVHWPDPLNRTPLRETIETLAELVEAKKIRYIGVSNFSVEQIQEAQQYARIVSLQSPYNLLQRGVEKRELKYVKDQNIGFIPYSPLAQGLLTGKFSADSRIPADDVRAVLNPLFQKEHFAKSLEKVNQLKEIASKYDKPLSQVAINWLLANPAVTTVIAGAKTPQQVEENVAASTWKLNEEDVQKIDAIFSE